MADPRAKRFDYAVEVRDTHVLAEGLEPLEVPEGWSPEHLVLAGLVRCTLTSLGYHGRQLGLQVSGGGRATGEVTRRESDGRYAFVEVECLLDVQVTPPPAGEQLNDLIAAAERDCFVGASLTAKPHYRWRVNGGDLS